MSDKVTKTDAQWREQMTADEYHVCREKGTERAFTGAYWDHWEPGQYHCTGCGEPLFDAETKFDAGCGWPSFNAPLKDGVVDEHEDLSFGMRRVEVTCHKCGCHLGHVFPDGPAPTGQRYCINSLSIKHDQDT
ncbi:peptide-methionine (R)-S-oxide reductase MsrB [Aestuariispira insulae]|uniref:Peptide methionine sulfoxide reductase MsrB n=1 Tax=Aestuariispira insulae TaxID=1461337 RepID=A0A3D9HZ85_9PROT|nr:peptide-methionine (R)-S-oxide reductase MsrB [Aestuariispira insulae]RED54216.1 peptide-methionine (R)-S-oxide reductase [Aestuariispira insulae]